MKKFNLAASIIMGLIATNAFAGGAAPFYLGATVGQSSTGGIINLVVNRTVIMASFTHYFFKSGSDLRVIVRKRCFEICQCS